MRFVVVLLALVALSSGYKLEELSKASDRSLASIIVDIIEAFKAQMPCGFPNYGIPILAPLKIEHQEFALETDNVLLKLIIDNFRLDGLNDFDILEFKTNPVQSKFSFKFRWNHKYLQTIYDSLLRTSGNFKWDLARYGNAKFGVKDVIISGSVKYSLGLTGDAISLKEFYLYATIGEVNSDIDNLSSSRVLNRFINDIIEEWIMIAINENTDYIAEKINEYLVPFINDKLGQLTLNDIVNGIAAGRSDGEGGEIVGRETEACVPQVDN